MDETDIININFIVIQKKTYLVCLFTLCRLSSFVPLKGYQLNMISINP